MAKEKPPEPPPEDIPAWFMTYSDVITLLMTFFILLLTFSTTEPEKFEKVPIAAFGTSGATGVAGHVHEAMDKQSWVQRVRPRAARIALKGSEMPVMTDEPSRTAVGRGIRSTTDEEAEKDIMTCNAFEVRIDPLVDKDNKLTPQGVELMASLAEQLRTLPVHCSIQCSSLTVAPKVTSLLEHLYRVQRIRPGQAGASLGEGVDSNLIRIVVERYEK